MRNIWKGAGKVIFWSYERGSWVYDMMVVAILLVVLATPRSWFHDEPHEGYSRAYAEVKMVGSDAARGTLTYRVDAEALPAEKRAAKDSPEMERETHDILARAAAALKGHTFQVEGIEPEMDARGQVAAYDVTVKTTAPERR